MVDPCKKAKNYKVLYNEISIYLNVFSMDMLDWIR